MNFSNIVFAVVIQLIIENYLTLSANEIREVKFFLYTRSNQFIPFELQPSDDANFRHSPFDPAVSTKILIHGINNTCESKFVQLVKNAYLLTNKVNIICCSYRQDTLSYYNNTVAKARIRGQDVATMISFLVKTGRLKEKDIHIIGHSLGAHIAGFAAQSLKQTVKIPRITGLDPAGPQFLTTLADKRLSEDDGQYVECVHTSNVLGTALPCGTADFYVNGGHNQPGCRGEIQFVCDHSKVYYYWAESIVNKNAFPALRCAKLTEAKCCFIAHRMCKNNGAIMGDGAMKRTPKGIYYVDVQK